jgi:hypothetical protein
VTGWLAQLQSELPARVGNTFRRNLDGDISTNGFAGAWCKALP